jgi:putative oxidoreductase
MAQQVSPEVAGGPLRRWAAFQAGPTSADAARLLLRGILALVFILDGSGKLFGLPGMIPHGLGATAAFFAFLGLQPAMPLAALVGVLELGAGLLLLVGLLTPLAALVIAVDMAVAIVKYNGAHGFQTEKPGGGFELDLILIVVALAAGALGGGPLSLDGRIGLFGQGRATGAPR